MSSNKNNTEEALKRLQRQVLTCRLCPRLVEYREQVARTKRRMYSSETYWGKPLPSFGDPQGELLILGLAPAAHGGNRTGRMFTGDRSGDFLFRALYDAGFANQPESLHWGDGLELRNCYITAALRCAPPANKPLPEELKNCRPYLQKELQLLKKMKAVLALGQIAFDCFLRLIYPSNAHRRQNGKNPNPQSQSAGKGWMISSLDAAALPKRSMLRFGHGLSYDLGSGIPRLYCSYHPSQQNTQTGKLTPEMLRGVLEAIGAFLE
jgi:uracil-DNA glycosylase family 4